MVNILGFRVVVVVVIRVRIVARVLGQGLGIRV